MSEKIIAIRKDGNGDIAYIKTESGKILSIEEVRQLANQGLIDSIDDLNKEGDWVIEQSAGTGERVEGHNLDMLPKF
ncbi:DUF3892 domain-containing protein [Fodinisporobacter ferrooxydans]|uniref:DUF3892 domain-containing protein n=1 Tax=Fodinisporobacter ferrooxydans TaxID=2901836 RepID=A0ABY4CML2_9BACL|nr:DUF3892 domain-containing protein [Alicyclobacillaceae bacterium MYW30-H2]